MLAVDWKFLPMLLELALMRALLGVDFELSFLLVLGSFLSAPLLLA